MACISEWGQRDSERGNLTKDLELGRGEERTREGVDRPAGNGRPCQRRDVLETLGRGGEADRGLRGHSGQLTRGPRVTQATGLGGPATSQSHTGVRVTLPQTRQRPARKPVPLPHPSRLPPRHRCRDDGPHVSQTLLHSEATHFGACLLTIHHRKEPHLQDKAPAASLGTTRLPTGTRGLLAWFLASFTTGHTRAGPAQSPSPAHCPLGSRQCTREPGHVTGPHKLETSHQTQALRQPCQQLQLSLQALGRSPPAPPPSQASASRAPRLISVLGAALVVALCDGVLG